MIQITEQDILELGIELNEQELEDLLAYANQELSLRVGNELLLALDEDQLIEYKKLAEAGDEQQISNFLQANIPELEDIVYDEMDILLGDIAEDSHKLEAQAA